MRLKKLSPQKDLLGNTQPQQYAARRFSNKAAEKLGHSVTSAAPFYLTSRDGTSLNYAATELFQKSRGALDLKSLAHETAPDSYNLFGYHNILNMGLGARASTYTTAPSTDWYGTGGWYAEELRAAQSRLLSGYDFKVPAKYVTTEVRARDRAAALRNKAKVQGFELGGLLRQALFSRSAVNLETATKVSGGSLDARTLTSLTRLRGQSLSEVYEIWLGGSASRKPDLKVPQGHVGLLESYYSKNQRPTLQKTSKGVNSANNAANYVVLDSQTDQVEEIAAGTIAELWASRVSEEFFPVRVMCHVEQGTQLLQGRIGQLGKTIATLRPKLGTSFKAQYGVHPYWELNKKRIGQFKGRGLKVQIKDPAEVASPYQLMKQNNMPDPLLAAKVVAAPRLAARSDVRWAEFSPKTVWKFRNSVPTDFRNLEPASNFLSNSGWAGQGSNETEYLTKKSTNPPLVDMSAFNHARRADWGLSINTKQPTGARRKDGADAGMGWEALLREVVLPPTKGGFVQTDPSLRKLSAEGSTSRDRKEDLLPWRRRSANVLFFSDYPDLSFRVYPQKYRYFLGRGFLRARRRLKRVTPGQAIRAGRWRGIFS